MLNHELSQRHLNPNSLHKNSRYSITVNVLKNVRPSLGGARNNRSINEIDFPGERTPDPSRDSPLVGMSRWSWDKAFGA